MDGLMSEATDLVLASRRDLSAGPMFNWESSKIDSADISSVTLLRLSITNSIKDGRSSQSEVTDATKTSRQNKGRRHRGSSISRKAKVDIQLLDREEDDSLCVKISAFPSEKTEQNGTDDKGQSNSVNNSESVPPLDSPNDEGRLEPWNFRTRGAGAQEAKRSGEIHADDKDQTAGEEIVGNGLNLDSPGDEGHLEPWSFKTQESETEGAKRNASNDKEQATRKKIVENGLKLASRRFSDGIFENCSTYSLTCPDILQERPPPKQEFPVRLSNCDDTSKDAISNQLKSASNDSASFSSESRSDGNSTEVCLSDSFFVNFVGDDCAARQRLAVTSKDSSGDSSKRTSRSSLPAKENGFSNSEVEKNNNGGQQVKSERRLSKKLRRRRKKNQSKDSPTYDCPKCGVSYILSPNSVDSTVRCLHCDFWTSVEPVFLKREKQPWNTCRIC